ncbi:FkbM family methyltransferase [Inquilinus limosus]|uniref:FkbM family methyltransferase n=1 Tax=Inquilinus limosus TaxID=171674 RepID=UPI003F17E316
MLLEASRRANNFDQVFIHSIAAHNTDGMLVLNTSHSNGTVRQPSTVLDILLTSNVVPAFQLDKILEIPRLDLVKIDVEGAEFEALSGFRETLTLYRPTIISEFAPTSLGEKCDAYLQFLIDLEYRLGVVMPNGDILDSGTEKSSVLSEWAKRNTDHIDVVAFNKPLG